MGTRLLWQRPGLTQLNVMEGLELEEARRWVVRARQKSTSRSLETLYLMGVRWDGG